VYTRNEVLDPTKLRGPAPRVTVLSRSWFRLLFAPTSFPTPEWLRYADVLIHEERGTGTWLADPRTPLWRHAEIQEYARMLVDVHNDVCATRTVETLGAAERSCPEVPVEIEAEVTGFRLILLTPGLVEPAEGTEPEGPAWLAPARATLYPPDVFELDIPESSPPWLVQKYRKSVDDIYSRVGFTLSEADAVIRAFAPGSPLTARLTMSFDIPEGYRRLVCSRVRNEGPQRNDSLLPRLSRMQAGFYRLDFAKSHQVSTLTFDLVNKTGTLSPDDPSAETLEYLETYLLAMRTVFGDDDGEGEYAALESLTSQLEATRLEENESKDEAALKGGTSPEGIEINTKLAGLEEQDPVYSPSVDLESTIGVSSDPADGPDGSAMVLLHQTQTEASPDPAPEPFPVDIDRIYAEYRARVLDIYKRSPPRQDQLQVLQERHITFVRASVAIDRVLSAPEGEELVDMVEARVEGMVPRPLRRWYALMQLNLPIWGQDLASLSERIAQMPDLRREELVGAEFEFEDEEACPICTDVVLPRDALAITPCYHLMHRDCLEVRLACATRHPSSY
jgi:hypothetical protein